MTGTPTTGYEFTVDVTAMDRHGDAFRFTLGSPAARLPLIRTAILLPGQPPVELPATNVDHIYLDPPCVNGPSAGRWVHCGRGCCHLPQLADLVADGPLGPWLRRYPRGE